MTMIEASIRVRVLALLVWLIPAVVTVAAYENFQAVETGVLMSPRYFQEYAASNASPLEKRQGQFQCPNNQHSCKNCPCLICRVTKADESILYNV